MPVVKVLSEAAYDERVELIKSSDKTPEEKGQMLGRLAMLSREASLNDQGKLLVPKDLSEQAGIVAEVRSHARRTRQFTSRSGARRTSPPCWTSEHGQQEDDELGIF